MSLEAENGRRLLIVVEPREFLRGCLRCWLESSCQEFEALMIGDIEASLHDDALRRAAAALITAHPPPQPGPWLEPQVRHLRARRDDLPVIVTVDGNDRAASEALAARWGLQGVLSLSSSIQVAAAAIRLVVAGGTYFPHEGSSIELPQEPRAHGAGGAILTPREQAVLDLLERGLPNKTIAYELGMSLGTVKVHVHNIMAKFKVRNRTAAVVAARAMGRGHPPANLLPIAALAPKIGPSPRNGAEL